MLRLLLLLLFPPLAIAGDTIMFFVPGDPSEIIGTYRRVGVSICSNSEKVIQQTGTMFLRDASQAGFQMATQAELLLAGGVRDKRSWQRNALLGIEAAGWLTTAIIASNLIDVKEKSIAGGVAIFTGALRYATTAIKPPRFELPSNQRPPIVVLAPGECREYSFYATMSAR
mgnify:CR=1 FL=1